MVLSDTQAAKLDSWKDWFLSRESSTSLDKENMDQLFSAFDPSLSANDCKAAVQKHEETVFMAKLSLNGGLNLLHHFKEVGGTLYDKEKEAGVIIGVSQSIATTMTPDTEKLFEKPSFAVQVVPPVTSILKATTLEEIDAR